MRVAVEPSGCSGPAPDIAGLGAHRDAVVAEAAARGIEYAP